MYDGVLALMALEPERFSVISQGYKGATKEYKAISLTGTKNVDIAVLYDDKFAISNSVKFITSNFSQNKNNYMENSVGETVMLRTVNPNTVFAYTIIIGSKRPYLYKDGTVGRIEVLSSETIKAYATLAKNPLSFTDYLIFSAIDTNNSQYFVKNQAIDWAEAGTPDIIFPKTVEEYLTANPTLDRESINFLVEHGGVLKSVIAQLEDAMQRQGAAFNPEWNLHKDNLLSALES